LTIKKIIEIGVPHNSPLLESKKIELCVLSGRPGRYTLTELSGSMTATSSVLGNHLKEVYTLHSYDENKPDVTMTVIWERISYDDCE
jgi:hypothetical protein